MRSGWKPAIAVAAALAAAACSVTVDVYGTVGQNNEIFTGTATGYENQTGTIELRNAAGVKCIGQYARTNPSGGGGLLTCSDGQRAAIQFTAMSMTSGYGFGTSDQGRPVKFIFGLTPQQGAKFIGLRPEQLTGAASAPGPAAPGAPPAPGPGAGQPRTLSSGTGFFITRQGQLLTNAHVVRGCRSVVVTPIGGTAVPANVEKVDQVNDLALLRADAPPQAIAALRGPRPLRQGDTIVAYGFPLAPSLSSGGVLTSGNVNALTGLRDDTRFLQISAPVQPGNSGGPLLDTTGAVVGIVTAGIKAGSAQNVNFALKADVARTFLSSIGVAPETAPGSGELALPDIGERARRYTVLVECKS